MCDVQLKGVKPASEVFITSASVFVMPVISIDGAPVGEGRPAPIADKLRAIYIEDRLAKAI